MSGTLQRAVTVTRSTEYESLLARHATHAQAEFFLRRRGHSIEEVRHRHELHRSALQVVGASIPRTWRRATVRRRDLAQFLFEPEDIVVVVGQDGLVANLSKYLQGQPVIGINPDPDNIDGILVGHSPRAAGDLIRTTATGRSLIRSRAMVTATLDDGQRLLALNEVFVGVRSHQSARYRIRVGGVEERQSSSGVIVSSGTGASGWARSIHRERRSELTLPRPDERALAFFVREAFPSTATETGLTEGRIGENKKVEITSENNVGGVAFGDGIESDSLELAWGQTISLTLADEQLRLVAA